MCGIAGIYNRVHGEPVDAGVLTRMTDALVHRGPDDAGHHLDGPLGLGHRRLSIIDLGGGHQPLANEDRTVWCAFNGEIYNFPSLREGLVERGHIFRTRSDTEVIVHLYEELGEQVFSHLDGMFAVALWDSRRKRLLLARDRFGKKPLFYADDGRRCVFASEMKAILEVPGIDRKIDLEGLSDYFSYLYVPNPKSILRSVRKIRPGHYAVVDPKGFREQQYWDVEFGDAPDWDEQRWCQETLDACRSAVEARLISDVPLGAFLSGGVDSSSVVALMSGLQRDPVLTSSIGFAEREFDETDYARRVAERFDTEHHERTVRPDAVGVVDKLVWHYDEPFADSSAVPTYYVSLTTREKVKVALSGDGGDEVFAGYPRYAVDQQFVRRRGRLPRWVRTGVLGAVRRAYPHHGRWRSIFRGRETVTSLSLSHIDSYCRQVSVFPGEVRRRLLAADVCAGLAGYDSADVFRDHYRRAPSEDPLARIQYVDIKTYLTDDILVKVDRASMAVSLEVRAPLLDHHLMALAGRLPAQLKLKGSEGKYILKRAFESLLPRDILYRPKMGFGVPLAAWFRGELREMAGDTLLAPDTLGLLDGAAVRDIWDSHQAGREDRSAELWTLFMFRRWADRFGATV